MVELLEEMTKTRNGEEKNVLEISVIFRNHI